MPAARIDSDVVAEDVWVGVAAMARGSLFMYSSPDPVTPDGVGCIHARLVSWLAGRCILPPSRFPSGIRDKTLSAYSRGGGCGIRPPLLG